MSAIVTATVNPDTLPGTNEILIIARELATDRFTFVEIQKKIQPVGRPS